MKRLPVILACALIAPATPVPVIMGLLFVSGLTRSMQFTTLATIAYADVPPEQLSMLGMRNVALGATALAGERVWQRDMRARLVIGPLSKEDYEAFLPGAERAVALERMLTLLGCVTLEYEVRLVLRRADVGASQLGAGSRLGWDAFLCTHEAESDRSDAHYELHVTH